MKAAASLARLDIVVDDDRVESVPRCCVVGAYLPRACGVCLAVFFTFSPRATMAFFTRPQSASAAIKIVAPSTVSSDSTKSSPKKGNVP